MNIETLKKTVAYEIYKQNKKDSILLQILIIISLLGCLSHTVSNILSIGLYIIIFLLSVMSYIQKKQIINYLKQKYNFS